MPDYSQTERLDRIQAELRRQSGLLEQLLALHQQAPATTNTTAPPAPAPQPKPTLVRRAVRWLRGSRP